MEIPGGWGCGRPQPRGLSQLQLSLSLTLSEQEATVLVAGLLGPYQHAVKVLHYVKFLCRQEQLDVRFGERKIPQGSS